MLADAGRLAIETRPLAAQLDRQPRQHRANGARKRHIDQALARQQVRVGEEIAGLRHRSVGNARALAALGNLGLGKALQQLGDDGQHPGAGGDAVLVGGEAGIGQQIGPLEDLAEARPMVVAGDADEDLVAIGGGEGLVDTPAAAPDRHGRHLLAGDRFARHVLPHHEDSRFEERALDEFALAARVAPAERG